jgi:hypothetical protein
LFGGVNYNVRGHVHYTRARAGGAGAGGPFLAPATYNAGPGRYWISTVNGWSAATPAWLVAQYAVIANLERTGATTHFNNTHPGVNLPLR